MIPRLPFTRLAIAGLALAFLAPAGARALDPATPPADVGALVTENLIARKFMINSYLGDKHSLLHYAESCTALGALRFTKVAHRDDLQQRLLDRYSVFFDPGCKLIAKLDHVDLSIVGVIPLQAYIDSGEKRWLDLGLKIANDQWAHPREDGLPRQTRWWIDDTFMVGELQAVAFHATGDPVYADRAGRFVAAYVRKLQQPSGLFYHRDDAPMYWGRGNGWVAVAMADVLRVLPGDHPDRATILDAYRKMMAPLLKWQREDGMWGQLIDRPEAWDESSCTAMFAYAMAVGVHEGWLNHETYGSAVDKAWRALVARVDDTGNLADVCINTGPSDKVADYLARHHPAGDLHGQAALMWLTVERMRK